MVARATRLAAASASALIVADGALTAVEPTTACTTAGVARPELAPARLLSRSAECVASAQHHCGLPRRLATSCDAAVPQEMRATAARQPSLTVAVCLGAVALLDRRRSRRARLLPVHGLSEPARLLSLSAECLASAEHHGRLSGRLATSCDAVVAREWLARHDQWLSNRATALMQRLP